jgi:hypothetical protein
MLLIWGGGYMPPALGPGDACLRYTEEEEDKDTCMSYEEEDTCRLF